jgi:hypothetical protein
VDLRKFEVFDIKIYDNVLYYIVYWVTKFLKNGVFWLIAIFFYTKCSNILLNCGNIHNKNTSILKCKLINVLNSRIKKLTIAPLFHAAIMWIWTTMNMLASNGLLI